MNVKIGFLRIWIVFSVLCLIVSFGLKADRFIHSAALLFSDTAAISQEIKSLNPYRTWPHSVTNEQFDADQRLEMRIYLRDEGIMVGAISSVDLPSAFANSRASSIFWTETGLALIRGLPLPVFFLVFGWVVAWVVRGFRSRE